MALRPIRLLGDDVLRKKAKKVEKINTFIKNLLDDMADTMYKNNGVGLAGNQVGVLKRVIVVDDGNGLLQLINPVITEKEGTQCGEEGCLSLPDIYGDVERAEKVKVKAQNIKGEYIEIEATGLLARIFQHETDHLDGKVFSDLATNLHEVKPDQEVKEEIPMKELDTKEIGMEKKDEN